MDGILLVDKPKGWTSFDVVAKVRNVIRYGGEVRREKGEDVSTGSLAPRPPKVKVGHTGTLDPAATGLLVLCIGKYTKKVPEMIRHDKTYEVEMTLGATSTTGDQEGVISPTLDLRPRTLDKSDPRSNIQYPNSEELEAVLQSFKGEQMQTPPAFSAIKVNGQRAYDLARAGKEVKLEPRKCTIYSLELTNYSYPIVKFTCSVSSGTYIRSLVEDIGIKLGTGAYMSELRRTKVADYDLSGSLSVDTLDFDHIKGSLIV